VDDYLEFCESAAKDPIKPFSAASARTDAELLHRRGVHACPAGRQEFAMVITERLSSRG